jgi:hypothetical protein
MFVLVKLLAVICCGIMFRRMKLSSLPNIVWVVKSRRLRWSWHVVRMGEERGVQRVLVGKPQRKRPLGRPRHRWADNIKMDF